MRRYRDFANRIDMNAFYEAISFCIMRSKGDEDIGHCPDMYGLHKNGDTTGKLAINREKRLWNCWVCGGGDLLSLAMGIWEVDIEQASDLLMAFAQEREISDERFVDEINQLLGQLDPRRERVTLPYFNEHVLDKWCPHPLKNAGLTRWRDGALDGRPKPISDDVLHRARVGYDPRARKYPPRDKKTKEALFEVHEAPAIVFPHFWRGRLVGWQQRWIGERPKWVPKYTNTTDFPKNWTLYNFEATKTRALPPVVVESVPTALFVETQGYPSVCTFGASVTPEQMKLLRRFQQGVILSPDNDGPGIQAAIKIVDYLDGFIPVSFIDPSEWGEGDDLLDAAVDLDWDASAAIREAELLV